jgi:hypothetical protein
MTGAQGAGGGHYMRGRQGAGKRREHRRRDRAYTGVNVGTDENRLSRGSHRLTRNILFLQKKKMRLTRCRPSPTDWLP